MHCSSEPTLTRPPPSRGGQSTHTTALPPTKVDASTRGVRESRSRWGRFLWFGQDRREAGFNSDGDVDKMGVPKSDGSREKPRRWLFRRMCC